MCGASKHAKRHIDAKVGATYNVAVNAYGQGAFVPPGETVKSCTACLRGDSQKVTFHGLSAKLKHELGSIVKHGQVTGLFVEVDEKDDFEISRDQINFGNGIIVDFADFAGSIAYIGVMPPVNVAPARQQIVARV